MTLKIENYWYCVHTTVFVGKKLNFFVFTGHLIYLSVIWQVKIKIIILPGNP
jgi:hypothetical protein